MRYGLANERLGLWHLASILARQEESTDCRFFQGLKKYMSLWDSRFVGWPDYNEHPVRKHDIEQAVAEEFRDPKTTTYEAPKPESIFVSGDVAVTYYLLRCAGTIV
jgi:hypothetical protein